jgi:hypothetical protein
MAEPGWQPIPAVSVPVEVAAAKALHPEPGFAVGDTAFASPTTGWAYVVDLQTAQCRVLCTEDAGATWRPQLAWRGLFYGRLAAFDERQAACALAVSQGDDINEYRPEPHAADDPFVGPDAFLAGTGDAGATWTLAPSVRGASLAHFLTPREMWLKTYVHGQSGMRSDLVRTRDGGATWQRLEGAGGLAVVDMHFQSATDGLMVAAEGNRADLLYRTVDAGVSWEPEPLERPPALPAKADVRFDPVARRDGGVLVLSARSSRDSARRPKWEGSYAYLRVAQRDWAGPYRLPMVPVRSRRPHPVAWGTDGRIWAAAGHDLFVADDPAGPWHRRHLPLPAKQLITRIEPVAGGVIWLTTNNAFKIPGAAPGGQLYRSADDGEHWNRVTIDCAVR